MRTSLKNKGRREKQMSNPKDGQRKWHVAAVILLGFPSLLTTPSPAAANNYHDFLCRIPYGPQAGRPAPAVGVTYAINNDFIYAEDTCSNGGSLYAQMVGETTHPFGTEASNTFISPAGLTIAAFTLWRYEADRPGQSYGTPASNLTYAPGGPISVQGLCTEGCSRGTPADPLSSANVVSVPELSGVTQIHWSAACGGGPGGECPASGPPGSGSLSSQYDVYAADIDLVDDTPPTVSDVSGPLVAGGPLSGQQAISFNASDGQSGVYSGSLIVDGKTQESQILDTNGGACQSLNVTKDGQRSFEYAQPCESSVSASLTLNTNLLAAGKHSLELIVEDAAGNKTIAYNGTITTSGPPTIAVNGGSITGALTPPTPAQIANGQPCAGEALELAINGNRKPPIVPYGKPVTVRGVLRCGTLPIRDVRIAVATLGGPASAAIDTSVQTALDGSFSYKVPTGPDRTLRFSYTAYSNDPGPSATATAAIMISPRISLSIKPHHVRNRHTIYWTGTIAGGPYPQQGVTLDVEVQEGRHWKIFDQVVANRKGRFRYSYHFRLTEEPTTYTFRVALPDTGAQGYPYTHGASNRVEVDVSP
jgi:hypothetical protein